MAHPGRNATATHISATPRTFFITTKTHQSRSVFQVERNVELLLDTLRMLITEKHFVIIDFVIMPDHIHIILEVSDGMTIEKAVQLIKGRFSYRMKNEFGMNGEIWQRGFTDTQIHSQPELDGFRTYIKQNPEKARLITADQEYPYCFAYLHRQKMQGLKPKS